MPKVPSLLICLWTFRCYCWFFIACFFKKNSSIKLPYKALQGTRLIPRGFVLLFLLLTFVQQCLFFYLHWKLVSSLWCSFTVLLWTRSTNFCYHLLFPSLRFSDWHAGVTICCYSFLLIVPEPRVYWKQLLYLTQGRYKVCVHPIPPLSPTPLLGSHWVCCCYCSLLLSLLLQLHGVGGCGRANDSNLDLQQLASPF